MLQSHKVPQEKKESTFLTQVSMSLIYIFGIVCYCLFSFWCYHSFVISCALNDVLQLIIKRFLSKDRSHYSRVESVQWSRMNSHVFFCCDGWWWLNTRFSNYLTDRQGLFWMWMWGRREWWTSFLLFFFFLVADVCVWGVYQSACRGTNKEKKERFGLTRINHMKKRKKQTKKWVGFLTCIYCEGDVLIYIYIYLVYLLVERFIGTVVALYLSLSPILFL
jgi:hypothetical protein